MFECEESHLFLSRGVMPVKPDLPITKSEAPLQFQEKSSSGDQPGMDGTLLIPEACLFQQPTDLTPTVQIPSVDDATNVSIHYCLIKPHT